MATLPDRPPNPLRLTRRDLDVGTLRATAIHEAGHSTAGVVLGAVQVGCAVFDPEGRGVRVSGLMGSSDPEPTLRPATPPDPAWMEGASMEVLLNDAALCVAGAIAEDLALGVRRGLDGVRGLDYAQTMHLAGQAFPRANSAVRRTFGVLACELARCILSRHWGAVEAVAQGLLAKPPDAHGRRILDSVEVRATYKRAMAANFPMDD